MTAAFSLFIACDGGAPSKTPDDIAADSALAADLALANRDTLLVDSIGEYRAPDADELTDDSIIVRDMNVPDPRDATPPPVMEPETPATREALRTPASTVPRPAPANVPAARVPAAPAARVPAEPAPRLSGTRACSSPSKDNQSECVRVTLASTDMRLNRIYRALITEIRRQEQVPPGAKDPPSVQRLRVSQRSWLVYRDNECRRRGRGKEGALWARPRVRCLGQFSTRRANELADNFSRLTAH